MLQYLPPNMKAMGEAQFVRIPKDEAEARQMVRDLKAKGVDGIKAVLERGTEKSPMKRLDERILVAICAEARLAGLKTVVYTTRAADVKSAFDAGADGVEYGSPSEPLPDPLLTAMASKGLYYDPTLSVYDAERMIADRDFSRLDDSLLQQAVPRDLLQSTLKT